MQAKDIRNACVYLAFDHFMFKFDLKSGYHNIDILQEHQTFLGFSWVVNAVRKFFVYTVLSFGLSSTPYIFTKVVRVLIRYWRSHALRITVYLDDGLVPPVISLAVQVLRYLLRLRFSFLVSCRMTVNRCGNQPVV